MGVAEVSLNPRVPVGALRPCDPRPRPCSRWTSGAREKRPTRQGLCCTKRAAALQAAGPSPQGPGREPSKPAAPSPQLLGPATQVFKGEAGL